METGFLAVIKSELFFALIINSLVFMRIKTWQFLSIERIMCYYSDKQLKKLKKELTKNIE